MGVHGDCLLDTGAMPKNKGKGGKNRSRAKSDRDGKRELHFKNVDEGQEYAQVLKMHGGPWLEAYCFDGVKRMCHICGKMGRKVRLAVGDIVLISLRGFQDNKADVIDKYLPDEVRALKTAGELPDSVKLTKPRRAARITSSSGPGGRRRSRTTSRTSQTRTTTLTTSKGPEPPVQSAHRRRQCRKRHCTSVVNVSNGTAPPCSQNWLEPHPQHGLASTCTPARLVAW